MYSRYTAPSLIACALRQDDAHRLPGFSQSANDEIEEPARVFIRVVSMHARLTINAAETDNILLADAG